MPAYEVEDQFGAYQYTIDAPTPQEAVEQAAMRSGASDWTGWRAVVPGAVTAAQTAPAAPTERERMTLDLMATGRAFLTRAYIDAQPDDEVQALHAYHCAPPEPVAQPVDIVQAMKTRASMKRIHQPALEPAGVVHMRQRRSTVRRYRAVVWDPALQVSTHLGVYDTQDEADRVKAAAHQRRAMGLPVRMD